MISSENQQEKTGILQEIFDKPISEPASPSKKPIIDKLKDYFAQPRMIDRWLAGSVLFFGLAAVALGIGQFRYNLVSYFKINPSNATKIGLDASQLNTTESQDLLGLRQKDTDGEGLSDYDELYVYHTSPYLKDTDSDGKTDSQEIKASTDPTCAAGQNCSSSFTGTSSATTEATADSAIVNGQIQAPTIRQLLVQAGFPQAELDKLSDVELQAAYQEILSQAQTGGQDSVTTVITGQGDISQLTPSQIRDLLSKQGIDQSILEKISDTELMSLVQETIKTTASSQ